MSEQFDGVSFPGWEVVRKIGQGSFGGVYEIRRTLPDGRTEKAALKKLSVPQDQAEIEEMLSQSFSTESITAHYRDQMSDLVKEYSLMQELSGCGNVVTCHDIRYVQQEGGIGWTVYIRMELLRPLKKALPVEYQEETVIRIGLDICNALKACQKKSIIHRDIKPENILVSENEDYKLTDFGIAKVSEKTGSGTRAGTNSYMAPEVANRQHYGASVDIYSLGMVLYWMMNCRTLPFLPLPPEIPTALQKQEAVNRRFDGEDIPEPVNGSPELKKVVMKACAFLPENRYASAAELEQALRECRQRRQTSEADEETVWEQADVTNLPGSGEKPHGTGFKIKFHPKSGQGIKIKFHTEDDEKPPEKRKKVRSKIFLWILVAAICLCAFLENGEKEKSKAKLLADAPGVTVPMESQKSQGRLQADPDFLASNSDGRCSVFGRNVFRDEIQTIEFQKTLENAPSDAWDLSEARDRSVLGWVTGSKGDYKMYIAEEGGVLAPENCNGLFSHYSNLIQVKNWLWFDTSQTTDMSEMFAYCGNLTSLDFNLNTSKVTSMGGMFRECESLEYVGVDNFDTSQVTDMDAMFFCCGKLKWLGVKNFDTSNVTSMRALFRSCESLKRLDVSGWDTAKVTNMHAMFYDCNKLESLDVSAFDTACVTNMTDMFGFCGKIERLDLRNFDTSSVTDMSSMFLRCSALTELNVDNFHTENVVNMYDMFYGCETLERLDLSSFNTKNVKNMSGMFGSCENMIKLRLTSFTTSKVEDMSYMFLGFRNVQILDLENFDFSWVTNYEGFMDRDETYNGRPWEELFA